MENVYDLIEQKKLRYIIPLDYCCTLKANTNKRIAVICHLHYYDTIENYFTYIKEIPKEMDIYITYSDRAVRDKILVCAGLYHVKVNMVRKENRGRDMSALLVTCRERILEYDYVCFLHDKKEKRVEEKEFTDKWIRELWENMIGSSNYIYNIINLFDKNPQLGLLVPPKPRSREQEGFYINEWYSNYENTCKLANEMNINCNLDKEKPPISLGTVFWCRVEALEKLLNRQWRYSDFEEEPLPPDGTLSHAIERIFSYVAKDAGFDTAMVLNDQIALEKMKDMSSNIQNTYLVLEKYGISNMEQLNKFENDHSVLLEFVKKYKQIYLYGAGKYGKICMNVLRTRNIIPTGFVVSQKGKSQTCGGVPIFELSEIDLSKDVGIIISVEQKNTIECIKNIELKDEKFNNYIVF